MHTTLRRRILVGGLWFLAGWVWVGAAVTLMALPGLVTPLGAVAIGALAVAAYGRRVGTVTAIAASPA